MKKVLKRTGILLLLAVLTLTPLGGCAKKDEDSGKQLRVGVVLYKNDDPFINSLTEHLKSDLESFENEELRIVTTVRNGESSQRTEDAVVEEIIDAGCDVLCVNLVDRTVPGNIIDAAKSADIPVIFFNREPVREDLMSWDKLYYVGCKASESGQIQGKLAYEAIKKNRKSDKNKDGKIQYIVLEGETGHQDAIIRTDSVVDTLKASGIELEKLSYQTADWSRAQAENKMTQMINRYDNQIELVLANNDEMALGAIEAYNKKNIEAKKRPLIFGTDGLPDALNAVAEGTLAGTVYNDKEGQAEAIAKLALSLYKGDDLSDFAFVDERYLMLDYAGITAENVNDYME